MISNSTIQLGKFQITSNGSALFSLANATNKTFFSGSIVKIVLNAAQNSKIISFNTNTRLNIWTNALRDMHANTNVTVAGFKLLLTTDTTRLRMCPAWL